MVGIRNYGYCRMRLLGNDGEFDPLRHDGGNRLFLLLEHRRSL